MTITRLTLAAILALAALATTAPADAADPLPPAPKPIARANLQYPAAALMQEAEGQADVWVQIAPDGAVAEVGLLSENPEGLGFGTAALAAVRQWRFAAGQPGRYVVTCKFRLELGSQSDAKILSADPPVHPPAALAAGLGGSATATLTITAQGKVKTVRIEAESPPGHGFGQAASAAFFLWRFEPGHPGDLRVTWEFKLPGTVAASAAAPTLDRSVAAWEALPWAPQAVHAVSPRLPTKARRERVVGAVDATIRVDAAGLVADLAIVREQPYDQGLAEVARAALRRNRYPAGHPGLYRVRLAFDHRTAPPDPAIDPGHVVGTLPPMTIPMTDLAKPPRASGRYGLTARVLVLVDASGRILATAAVSEKPSGQGMAEAAVNALDRMDFPPMQAGVYAGEVSIKVLR